MKLGTKTGLSLKALKAQIGSLTNQLEEIRREKALKGLVDDKGNIMKTEDEDQIQDQLIPLKQRFQVEFGELRNLKANIQRIQKTIENAQKKVRSDFNSWYKVMQKKAAGQTPQQMTCDPKVASDLEAFNAA